jgi:hypothetical protein
MFIFKTVSTEEPTSAPVTIYTDQDAQDSASTDKYTLLIANPQNDNDEEVGIAFRISDAQEDRAPGAAITHERTAAQSVGKLHFKTTPDGTSGASTRMTIDDSGNVGINNTAPGALLEVTGGCVLLDSGVGVNEFSTDGTLAGNSDDAVPTEQAVKTYVDGEVTTSSGNWLSEFLNIPALTGLWTTGFDMSSSLLADLSGNTHRLKARAGGPALDQACGMGYWRLNGNNEGFSGDGNIFDVTGKDEFISNAYGMATAGWFALKHTGTASNALMSKRGGSGSNSWAITYNAVSGCQIIYFDVYEDGTNVAASTFINLGGTYLTTWFYCAARYVPGSSIDLFVNGSWAGTETSIPASIHSNSASFRFGGQASIPTPGPGFAGLGWHSFTSVCQSTIENTYNVSKLLPMYSSLLTGEE